MESLLPPAAHIVKHLGPKASPHNYLCLLDSAYDTVDDGDSLFARFFKHQSELRRETVQLLAATADSPE